MNNIILMYYRLTVYCCTITISNMALRFVQNVIAKLHRSLLAYNCALLEHKMLNKKVLVCSFVTGGDGRNT